MTLGESARRRIPQAAVGWRLCGLGVPTIARLLAVSVAEVERILAEHGTKDALRGRYFLKAASRKKLELPDYIPDFSTDTFINLKIPLRLLADVDQP